MIWPPDGVSMTHYRRSGRLETAYLALPYGHLLADHVQVLIFVQELLTEGPPGVFRFPIVHGDETRRVGLILEQLAAYVAGCAAEQFHPVALCTIHPFELFQLVGCSGELPGIDVACLHAAAPAGRPTSRFRP